MTYHKKITTPLLLCLMALTAVGAQKAKKKAAPVVEVDPKVEMMLASTQQIVFVDSIVLDKEDFLNAYLISPEAGSLMSYNSFFHTDSHPYATVYVNQLGNKSFYSQDGQLYTADLLADNWSQGAALQGLGDFELQNYPFMLSDGLTFYFAAISDEGLGGLDIYMSRYDADNAQFLRAENIGMPFNSAANDYMYVIDDMENIGYFATDRRQPENKVCIYTFIPNQTRLSYNIDELGRETVSSRAAINRIADTWTDANQRHQALERIAALKTMLKGRKTEKKSDFIFPVDDNHIYTSINDFHIESNRHRMTELLAMKERLQRLESEIDKSRRYYAKAAGNERLSLASELAAYEQQQQQITSAIHEQEKLIRNTEIQTYY